MKPKQFVRNKYTIERTDSIFTDEHDGRKYHTEGSTIDLSADNDITFDVYVDGELIGNNVSTFNVLVQDGSHTVSLVIGDCDINFDYEGKADKEYTYTDNVQYRIQRGFNTIAEAFSTSIALPVASLAIPILGPILSVSSLVLIPFFGLGGVLMGLGQIIAALFTA